MGDNIEFWILGCNGNVSWSHWFEAMVVLTYIYSMLTHLEPLATAIMVCQGSTMHADQVTLMFGKLAFHFTSLLGKDPIKHAPIQEILKSLRKRWANMDQDIFLLTMVLNPFISRKILCSHMTVFTFVDIAVHLYQRIFQTMDAGNLRWAFAMYWAQEGVFGSWTVQNLQEMIGVSRLFHYLYTINIYIAVS